jgi:hypothetical protein
VIIERSYFVRRRRRGPCLGIHGLPQQGGRIALLDGRERSAPMEMAIVAMAA